MAGSDWKLLLEDLAARREAARAMGGTERLERHRAGGRLDARQRIDHLFDPGTFVELGSLVGSVHRGVTPPTPADGLVAGHGLIDGRPVLGPRRTSRSWAVRSVSAQRPSASGSPSSRGRSVCHS
ncbi:MAG: carboxyl transferase domain-containing protein [Acidimicrobiia bacterium]